MVVFCRGVKMPSARKSNDLWISDLVSMDFESPASAIPPLRHSFGINDLRACVKSAFRLLGTIPVVGSWVNIDVE